MINLNDILFKKLLINKFKPSSRKDIKDYRSFIDYLRNTGKEKILERLILSKKLLLYFMRDIHLRCDGLHQLNQLAQELQHLERNHI